MTEQDKNQPDRFRKLKVGATIGGVAISLIYLGLEVFARQNQFGDSKTMVMFVSDLLKESAKSYLRKQKKK